MQVEFQQKLKDDDYVNFGLRHYFFGNKKNIISAFVFPAIGLVFILLHFILNSADNFLLIIGIVWLCMPFLRYFSVKKQMTSSLNTSKIKDLEIFYKFYDEAFEVTTALTHSVIKYGAVFDYKETKKYIHIHLSNTQAYIIDKEQIELEKLNILKQIIAAKHPTSGLLNEIN